MNLENLSEDELISKTKFIAKEEQRYAFLLLQHLSEIERRRLFLDLGFGSLHEYVVKELGYSDGAAQRRIQSMRLARDVPQAMEALETGKLNLSTASMVQRFFQYEKKVEKAEILKKVEGKSQRETEEILRTISPAFIPKERERVLSHDEVELRLILPKETLAKLKRLRELTSHKNSTYVELIDDLAEKMLDRLDPMKKATPLRSETRPKSQVRTRYIPSRVRREVWQKAQGKCTYQDPKTRRQCCSTYRLQIEHIHPYALGGPNTLENLTLLCASHNQRNALRIFGDYKLKF